MYKTICIISHQHLSRNPRVLKESLALRKLGHKIIILTAVYSELLLIEDHRLLLDTDIEYIFYSQLSSKNLANYIIRGTNKIGRYLNFIGIENKFALGYAPNRCLDMAFKTNADLFICHQELPLHIGAILLKNDKKVMFDIEDWYTQDLLLSAQKFRPKCLLQKYEAMALKQGIAVLCTSKPMAESLSLAFKANEPEVIFNSFTNLYSQGQCKPQSKKIRIIWISQTTGPGRGLEEIVTSMNKTDNVSIELNLRGNVSEQYKACLNKKLSNPKHKLVFLPLISNTEIQSDLLNFDIGLASEPSHPKNKDLTISNKIFHYLSVGLPVIASATNGQLSLNEDFPDGIFYYQNSSDLANILSNFSKKSLEDKRAKILETYKQKYDWSIMEKKLQNIVQRILS